MEEKIFPVLQSWRIRRVLAVVLGVCAALAAAAAALQGLGWSWWLFAVLMLGLVSYNLLGLIRQPWVVKLGPMGVDVRLATGRVMHAGWGEIEAHTITPGGRIGALLVRPGPGTGQKTGQKTGAALRVLPISTRLIGPAATQELLAALKDRLPKLQYRVPSVGGVRAG